MGKIQVKRGTLINLPTSASPGELLYTTDEKDLYVGNGDGFALTKLLNADDVTNLVDSKIAQNAPHEHTSDDISDFSTAVQAIIDAEKGVPNGLVELDENGLIPTSAIPTKFKEANVVANITERDGLEVFEGLHALVLDATADSTVEVGGAEYVFDGTDWVKIAELSAIDALVSWNNVTDKPNIPTSLTDLTDVAPYEGNAGKLVVVNASGTGFDYISADIDGGEF